MSKLHFNTIGPWLLNLCLRLVVKILLVGPNKTTPLHRNSQVIKNQCQIV